MKNQVPEAALSVCQILQVAGHEAVVVGGCVRDMFLGRDPHDWDVATSAMPEQVTRIFARGPTKVIPTGIKHGTVTVLFFGEPIEVTTFRSDGDYSDGRRPDDVKLGVTLEEDLSRRDFTMNAMALDPVSGKLTDPFGGKNDILFKTIRTVGKPIDRFMEDGLRMMRAVRFAATLGFEVCSETRGGIRNSLLMIEGVSQERIRDELLKLLGADKPSVGLRIAHETGLLWKILPELRVSAGHPQNQWHALDVWEHVLLTVDHSMPDPIHRLGALLHDVAKPACAKPAYGPGQFSFINHCEVGADMTREIVERLKFSNAEKDRIEHMVRHHMALFGFNDKTTKKALRKIIKKVGVGALPDILCLSKADVIGKGTGEDPEERFANVENRLWEVMREISCGTAAVKTSQLAINGRDIMTELGIKPGPQVGDTLRTLLERVMDSPELNNRESLLKLASEITQ